MDYGRILSGGYDTTITSRAFYPLFPVCVWIVQTITFGQAGLLVAGFIFNTIATWLAVVALLKIARYFFTSAPAPWLVVAAFLTAPTAFSCIRSTAKRSLCSGFLGLSFRFAASKLWMGLSLIPITASRITAVLFAGLCFLEFWRSKEWKIRGLLSWPLLRFPAAFAGLAAFMVYMHRGCARHVPRAESSAIVVISRLQPEHCRHGLEGSEDHRAFPARRHSTEQLGLGAVNNALPFIGRCYCSRLRYTSPWRCVRKACRWRCSASPPLSC
jgi:hypothetical protein